jgi:basic amino acid/polyamine antiporter, APA family
MPEKTEKLYARDATGLVRQFGWLDIFYISTAGLGVGVALVELFNWTPYIFPGADLAVGMFIGFIVCLFVGLSYVLLSVSMPRSGGDYVFTSRTLGPRWGFLANFTLTAQNLGFVAVDTTLFTSVILSGGLAASATATGSAALQNLAVAFSNPLNAFILAIFVLVFYATTVIVGGKLWKVVTLVFMVLGYVSLLMLTGILAGASHSTFVSAFNSMTTGLKYDQIIPTAQGEGFTIPPITLAASLAMLPYATLFYLGFERGTFIAGETKRVSFAMPVGTFISLGIGLVFFAMLPSLIFGVVGADWYKSLLFLFNNKPNQYPLPIAPGPNLFAAMVATPVVAVVFSIMFITWGLMGNLARFQCFSRSIFAWSFDRVVPTAFSRVSERFHTPYVTTLTYLVGTIICTAIAYFTGWLSFFFSILGVGYLIRTIVYISATVFPYRKNTKKLYQASPLKPHIGPVPLITIAGAIASFFFLYMSYQTYSTLASKTFSALVTPAIGAAILFGVFGLGIYQAAKMYWKGKGIDINMAFSELPPE